MEAIVRSDRAMPQLNKLAPAFEAKTTHGMKKLSDY
jgi:hypothetical protein